MKFFNKINFCLFSFLLIATFICISVAKASEIRIKHIKVNNVPFYWGIGEYNSIVKYSKLDSSGMPVNLKFLYNVNSVSFKFSQNDSAKLLYRNRLEGSTTNWTNCDTNIFSTYNQLKVGKYTYHIQALKQNKIVCEIKFKFEIGPDEKEIIIIDIMGLLVYFLLVYMAFKIN
jgi:hypothetical protein